MSDISFNNVPLLHQLVPSHIGSNNAAQGTPEQHFANHLQDHYGLQAQDYSQQQVSSQANHFAAQHCGGHNDPMAALLQLVNELRQEITLLKHGAPPPSPSSDGPKHETFLEARDRLTQLEVETKAHFRENEEKLAIAELETKMAKKMRDSILQSI
jgi:hypothetical protein